MVPYRLLAISSTLLLGAFLAGPPGAPLATSALATSAPIRAQSAAAPAAALSSTPTAAAAPAAPRPPSPTSQQSSGAPVAPSGQGGLARRVELAGPDGKLYPYTIELPAGWAVLHSKEIPGVFLGPASVSAPESDSRVIYVRVSPVSLANPDEVVANIKKSAAAADSWSAPLVEVREIGGVRGVLVRMDSGSGEKARSTLVLKMPLGETSLDFMASAPRAEFERQLPGYQRVILSVLPAR
jgi:hypothetical protein